MKQTHEFYTHISDIWYYDGPLLSYCKDLEGEDMLMYWVDYSYDTNTWLASTIGDKLYTRFINKEIDLRACIVGAKINILLEIDSQVNVIMDRVVNINEYPKYLPDIGCMYDIN